MSHQPGQFEVGQLYLGEYRNGLKVWSQSAIGDLVYPQAPQLSPPNYMGYQQYPMAYSSQYVWGCGHATNTAEILTYYDPYAEGIMALTCCPVCSFIAEIQTLSDYQSYIVTPIVVA